MVFCMKTQLFFCFPYSFNGRFQAFLIANLQFKFKEESILTKASNCTTIRGFCDSRNAINCGENPCFFNNFQRGWQGIL